MCTKAGTLILMLLIVVPCMLGGCSGSSGGGAISPQTGMETGNPVGSVNAYSHDNYVYFKPGNFNISGATFDMTGYSITEGQPWHGVTSDMSGVSFAIDVNCGRKDSVSPAEWFLNSVQGGPVINTLLEDNLPSELNFAVSGILSIGGNAYTIVIGQKGISVGNIWYMGGVNFKGDSAYNQMTTPDGKYTFGEGGSDDIFSVTQN
jgi:hypothetical protein